MSATLSGAGPRFRSRASVRTASLATAALVFLIAAVGCESGPSGPGALEASVENPAMSFGAAVIEVQGAGVTGFDAVGTTRLFWSATSQPDNYRLVVISPEGSSAIRFRVRVNDLGGPLPVGTVLEAADLLNAAVTGLSHFSVRMEAP